jgi:hypothetical protein
VGEADLDSLDDDFTETNDDDLEFTDGDDPELFADEDPTLVDGNEDVLSGEAAENFNNRFYVNNRGLPIPPPHPYGHPPPIYLIVDGPHGAPLPPRPHGPQQPGRQ